MKSDESNNTYRGNIYSLDKEVFTLPYIYQPPAMKSDNDIEPYTLTYICQPLAMKSDNGHRDIYFALHLPTSCNKK